MPQIIAPGAIPSSAATLALNSITYFATPSRRGIRSSGIVPTPSEPGTPPSASYRARSRKPCRAESTYSSSRIGSGRLHQKRVPCARAQAIQRHPSVRARATHRKRQCGTCGGRGYIMKTGKPAIERTRLRRGRARAKSCACAVTGGSLTPIAKLAATSSSRFGCSATARWSTSSRRLRRKSCRPREREPCPQGARALPG